MPLQREAGAGTRVECAGEIQECSTAQALPTSTLPSLLPSLAHATTLPEQRLPGGCGHARCTLRCLVPPMLQVT